MTTPESPTTPSDTPTALASGLEMRTGLEFADRQLGHRKDIDQRCFHSVEDVEGGAVLSKFWAREHVASSTYLTVQVDRDKHILLTPERLQYINHSCEPNVFFDTTRFELVSLTSIRAGAELCYFYPSTEWNMAQPFACKCGSPDCIETIRGASEISTAILRRYRLNTHIEDLLREPA